MREGNSVRVRIVAIILLVLSAVSASGAFLPPVVTVRRVTPPVTAEAPNGGPLGKPTAYPISELLSMGNKGKPTQRTQVQMAYDDESLYVMFTCAEARPNELTTNVTENNGPVWRDDSVEVLLNPFPEDHSRIHHLAANAKGIKYASVSVSGNPENWDGPWRVEVAPRDGSWVAWIRIPFGAMGGTGAPKPGDVWEANFARHEVRLNELSSWSPVINGFVEPERFGRIVFGDAESVVASVAMPDIPTPGKYPVAVHVSNPSASAVKLGADVILDGKVIGTADYSAPSKESDWRFILDYPLDGKHDLSIAIVNAAGKVIARTGPTASNIAPNLTRLNAYRAIARALKPTSSDLVKELTDLKTSLGGLVEFSKGAKGSADMWQAFGDKLDVLEPRVAYLRYACTDMRKRGYVVGVETPIRKILRHQLFEGQIGGTAKISAARNEYEAVQAVVMPWNRALNGVSVSVTPLQGKGGAVIPADRIKINLVEYVKTRKPRYDVDYIGWWPDPLMDMKPFDVAQGSMQPVWITVHPSEDTPAGVYKGEIVILPQNAPETRMPLEVRVWDFTIPKTPALKTAFALFSHEIAAWYDGYTDDIRKDFYQFLLDHRVNPTNIYSRGPTPEKPDLPFCVENGLNAFCLAYTHNKDEEGRSELASMIKDYESYLKEKGWWDKAYLYGFDEIPRDKYGELRDMYGWAKKTFPDLPRMCTVVPNEELKGYVDIWVPLTANYNIKNAQEYTKAGDQVWWYVCCNPSHPYPNFFIDYPAMDQRAIFWITWKYRIPGFLYYAINLWQSNRSTAESPGESRAHEDPKVREAIKAGKRWPEVPWNSYTFDNFNGDGVLIYPGPNRKPLSSIRFECIRDGIEDYDCLRILEDLTARVEKSGAKVDAALLARAKKMLAVEEVAQSPSEYTPDPNVLLKARADVAETIEKLLAVVGK